MEMKMRNLTCCCPCSRSCCCARHSQACKLAHIEARVCVLSIQADEIQAGDASLGRRPEAQAAVRLEPAVACLVLQIPNGCLLDVVVAVEGDGHRARAQAASATTGHADAIPAFPFARAHVGAGSTAQGLELAAFADRVGTHAVDLPVGRRLREVARGAGVAAE